MTVNLNRRYIRLLNVFEFCCLAAACLYPAMVFAQSPSQITQELGSINSKLTAMPYSSGKSMLISNRAMNIFLSNKVSSYLSADEDLSLYKNYVTLNTAEGKLTIDHNFHQPVDSDDYVRSFTIVGAQVNVANTYAARFSNKYFDNQLGVRIKQTWMGKPVTFLNKNGSQKQFMDANRALILHSLEAEINKKATDFEQSLNSIKQTDIPGQNITTANKALKRSFYSNLRAEYLQKFAEAQSDLLIRSGSYKSVSDSWTSISAYLPVIRQQYKVSTGAQVSNRYSYPFEVSLTHTRFWESFKAGRIFFTLNAKAKLNNTIQNDLLYPANMIGEVDGENNTVINNGNVWVGDFKNFITPVAACKLVYIPPNSHVGASFRIEQNIGRYHALNAMVGIPIVLIDKNGVPAITFECQLLYADWNNSIKANRLPGNKTAVGVTVGIPFSKIVY
jgi:hypothetical protein